MRNSSLLRYSLLAASIGLIFTSQAQAAQYRGVITDQQGEPIKNARVHIHGRQQYVYADALGRFSIEAQPDAELHIDAPSYGDSYIKLTTEQLELSVSLTKGGIERIVVSASGIHKNTLDMVTPVSVLSGEELQRRTEPTIGETLKFEPGVHANYYGPVASSPVIRGLDGPRVRVLNNGLDTADVSRVGPDHAISADALTAQQIEVLRGPATLLYGSGAIGGVINVVDNRIPRQLRQQSETQVHALYADVSKEKSLALNHEGSVNNIAWHVDGFNRKTSDYSVPRFTNDEGESLTSLENSWLDSKALNTGLSYIGAQGLIGISIGRLESDYGIPGHHHHAEEADAEPHTDDDGVFAALKQNRISLAGEWYNPVNGIETLSINTAYTDYQHQEIEAGTVGTTFKNKALESRLTLEHEAFNGWHGLFGYHLQQSNYSAFGEEAFTPDSDSLSHALFVMEEKQIGQVGLQFGGRIERTKHDIDHITLADGLTIDHVSDQFTASSVSAGAVWQFIPGFSWALAYSRSERAPSAAELYANGAHIATSSYELGLQYAINAGELAYIDTKAKKETANNIDLTFRHFKDDLTFTYNFFYNKVHNYLYQANTGLTMADLEAEHDHVDDEHDHEHHDSFPLYQYQQHDATLYGMEFEARYQLDSAQALNVFADTVRAKLDNGDYLPRIPPYKLGLGYQYTGLSWSADVGVTHYGSQTKLAVNETSTPAYTLLDANLNYDVNFSAVDVTLFARGTNLTNKLGFVHSSFIKDDAPLPGRAITLGLRAKF
ncbi:TonB-dependent receptor [Rheinheimera sp. D18]|uniref:TonB-dependent receptor n=1 Tax=Rheinheimera sp. D18 TaxID=2545632 RepID=UPI0010450402|nr:TonB-dependent receptor [Rheinheimera sp. D18]QBL09395.1 TonB-dependent receptor [Rheinheimera sp. D18]